MTSTAWRPPILRGTAEGLEERPVSWTELFYDLVFVVAIARLGERFFAHPSREAAFEFIALFGMLWWAWASFTFLVDRYHTDDALHRLLAAVQMLGVAGMAAAVALEEESLEAISVPIALTVRGDARGPDRDVRARLVAHPGQPPARRWLSARLWARYRALDPLDRRARAREVRTVGPRDGDLARHALADAPRAGAQPAQRLAPARALRPVHHPRAGRVVRGRGRGPARAARRRRRAHCRRRGPPRRARPVVGLLRQLRGLSRAPRCLARARLASDDVDLRALPARDDAHARWWRHARAHRPHGPARRGDGAVHPRPRRRALAGGDGGHPRLHDRHARRRRSSSSLRVSLRGRRERPRDRVRRRQALRPGGTSARSPLPRRCRWCSTRSTTCGATALASRRRSRRRRAPSSRRAVAAAPVRG